MDEQQAKQEAEAKKALGGHLLARGINPGAYLSHLASEGDPAPCAACGKVIGPLE